MITVDLDSLFEAYFRKYLIANQGKFNEDQLENKVGEIYKQFGNEPLKELGGKSPRKYYADKSEEELVKELETSVKNSLPVSDFLCEELENRKGAFKYLIKFVDDAENDELATYAVIRNFVWRSRRSAARRRRGVKPIIYSGLAHIFYYEQVPF